MNNKKKTVILVGDGMADSPLECGDAGTPLAAAHIPHMDAIARDGCGGTLRTVPIGMKPGSDVANLSILGYDPQKYYTGRGPLEAVAQNVQLSPDEICFRCNLITCRNNVMEDYSGGAITTEASHPLIALIATKFNSDDIRFYPGVGFRHVFVISTAKLACDGTNLRTIPPHDISGKDITASLPLGEGSDVVRTLMSDVHDFLENDPAAREARTHDGGEVTDIWLWGQGRTPSLPSFEERHGIARSALITAVDLLRGIARAALMQLIPVPGATGYVHTNYKGKANALIKGLKHYDFILLHLEGPDEAGHCGCREDKIYAIEHFDAEIVGPIYKALQKYPSYSLAVLPDHPTPLHTRTHTDEPVPVAVYGTDITADAMTSFTEEAAEKGIWQSVSATELIHRMQL